MFELTGKIAVITGGASGIGLAIAGALGKAGAHVFVLDTDKQAGPDCVEKLHGQGCNADFIETDVAQESSCRTAADAVLAATGGRCDILVNNAGVGHVGTLLSTSAADLDRLMSVNVKGVMFMTQAFLPAMIERRWGSVIHLASIGGIVAVRERFAYCATKFAVVGMTKCMALDFAHTRVRFNCICPGRVETPFVQARLREYADPQKAYAEMSATQALGRMGQPDEIAAAALYLASDESAFVTGSSLIIDGGWSAGK